MKKTVLFILFIFIVNTNLYASANNNLITEKNISQEAVFYYALAMFNLYNKNFKESEQFLLRTLKAAPDSPYLNFKTANFYLHFGNVKNAIKYCEKTLILAPNFQKAHELLASIYAATNNVKGAINEYKYLLTQRPDNPVFQMNYGLFLLRGEQFEQAKKVFKKLTKKKDNKYKIMGYYYLGKIYSKIKLYKEALRYYNEALKLKPDFFQAYYDIGLVYELEGNDKKAYKNYMKVIEINNNDILAREKIVRYLVKKNKLKEAVKYLKKLKDLEGDNIDINIKLALIYMELKKFKNSIDILKKYKDFPKAQYYLISTYLKLDDTEDAVKTLEKIRTDSNYYFDSAVLIINALLDKKDFDYALKIYLSVLKKFKEKNLKMYKFGLYLFDKSHKYKEGIAFLNEAIEKFPKVSEFYFYKGLFYDKLGNLKKVIQSMQKAIDINPDSADALNYLGYTYAVHNINLDDAEYLVKKALKLRPDSAAIIDSLGWIYFQKGDYDNALKTLQKAYTINQGKEPEIIYHLGKVYIEKGNYDLAKKYLEEALKLSKENELKNKIKKELGKIK